MAASFVHNAGTPSVKSVVQFLHSCGGTVQFTRQPTIFGDEKEYLVGDYYGDKHIRAYKLIPRKPFVEIQQKAEHEILINISKAVKGFIPNKKQR